MASRRRSQAVQSQMMNPAQRRAEIYRAGISDEVLDDLDRWLSRRSSHVPGDPYTTAFREGQRDVYRTIRALVANDTGESE